MINEVWIWNNGMVMAFDEKGQQVTECQGFILEVADKLKAACDANTTFQYARKDPPKHIECDFSWWFERESEGEK